MNINKTVTMFLLLLPTMLFAGGKASQKAPEGVFLEPMQQRDSALIGDQFLYGVRLKDVQEGTKLSVLKWDDSLLSEDLELIGDWKCDTLSKEDAPKKDIMISRLVTSFEEGTYELPSIKVQRWFKDGVVDTISFESRFLDIKTMPVDTATFEVHDIKGQIRYPVTAREILTYGTAVLLLVALVFGVIFLIRRFGRKKEEEMLRREPAHIVALRKLDKYRGDKYWEADKQKIFYSGVTDTLREYIAARYGVGAMEMTSSEIFEGLKDTDVPKELYDEMKALFERADFVKFAKMTVSKEDNATVLPSAVNFVTKTYQSEIEEEVKEEV